MWAGEGGKGGATALRTKRPEWAASAEPSARTVPRRVQSFMQGHQLEQAAQGGPVDYRGAIEPLRARNSAEARTCRAMPRHSAVERSRIAFSIKMFWETAPVKAVNSASSWRIAHAGGAARPYVSWDTETKRHAPVPVRPYLSRFNASLASADIPVPQAAAATAEDASGCVTHTSNTTGRPGRYRRRSPRWGSRWERGGSRGVPVALPEWAVAAAPGRAGGLARGVRLWRALRWPLPRWAQQRHWPQRERLRLRPRRER